MIKRGTRKAVYPKSILAPYPYGINNIYKASNLGLYGGARIGSGNNVSPITKTKTRRRWYPNVQNKKLWSVALDQFIKLKVTARVLRTIDKVGGLDEYLLGERQARIKELGLRGWILRSQVMQTKWYTARRKEEAERLGLSERQVEGWNVANMELRNRIADLRNTAEGLPVPERGQREVLDAVEVENEVEEEPVDGVVNHTEVALPNQKQGEDKIQFMVEQPVSEPPRARL
jgi:large subunit ribosomal protein L28